MLTPTEEFLTAVIKLGRSHDWDIVERWLKRQHTLQSARNDTQRDDTLLRMGQGKAQCLGELARIITPEFAARALETLKSENGTPCIDNETLRFTAYY